MTASVETPGQQSSTPVSPSLGVSVSWVSAAQFAALALGTVPGVIIAHALTLSERGHYAVMIALAGVAALCVTAGLDSATLRASGSGGLGAAYRATQVRIAVVLGASVAYAAVAMLLPNGSVLSLTSRDAAFAAVPMPALVASQLLGNCLIGVQRSRAWSLITVANTTTYAAMCFIIFVTGHASPAVFTLCVTSGYTLSAAGYWLALRRYPKETTAEDRLELRRTAFATAPSTLAQLAMLRVQLPLLQILSTATAVALLAVATPIAEALLLVPVAVGTVLLPRYAQASPSVQVLRKHALRVGVITAACAVMISVIAWFLIPKLYGPQYSGSRPLVPVIAPGLVLFAIGRVGQSQLIATGRFGRVMLSGVVGLITTVALQALLSNRFGALGAAIAVSVGYAAASIPLLTSLIERSERPTSRAGTLTTNARFAGACGFVVVIVAFAVFAKHAGYASTSSLVLLAATAAFILSLLCIIAFPVASIFVAMAPGLAFGGTYSSLEYLVLLPVLVNVAVQGFIRSRRASIPRIGTYKLTGVPSLGYVALLLTLIDGLVFSPQNVRTIVLLTVTAIASVGAAKVAGQGGYSRVARFMNILGGLVGLVYLASGFPKLTLGGLQAWANVRDNSEWLNYNTLGLFFLVCLSVSLSNLVTKSGGPIRFIFPLIHISAVLFTFSRSSYVALVAVLVCFCVLLGRRALWGLIPIAWLMTHLPGAVQERVQYTTAGGQLDNSSAVRIDLWSQAWNLAVTHPLSGVGVQTLGARFDTVSGGSLAFAHNTYLTVLAGLGPIFGLCALGVLLHRYCSVAAEALSRSRRTGWAMSVFMAASAALVCSFFGEPMFSVVVAAPLLIVIVSGKLERSKGVR